MSLIAVIVILAFWGIIVGAFARLALPGRDPMTIPQTMAIGLAGSFLAGLAAYAISGSSAGWSFLSSLVFSVLIVYFIRRRRGGGLVDPGVHEERHPRR